MKEPNYNSEDLKSHDGIAAVIKDGEEKILMQEHAKYGFWTIPVGKVEKGQTIKEGLKQEVYEEVGIKIEECEEVCSRTDNYARNGHQVEVILHIFEVKKYSGKIENKEPEKHPQQIFKSINEILAIPYLSDATLGYLVHKGFHRKARI